MKRMGNAPLVPACAGTSPQRGLVAEARDMPVVEAVQAAVAQALGRVLARNS